MSTGQSDARSRSSCRDRRGCWTCRKRKKKCHSTSDNTVCDACQRLGLRCDRGTRLVWEDDQRRDGINKRGPARKQSGSPPPMAPGNGIPAVGTVALVPAALAQHPSVYNGFPNGGLSYPSQRYGQSLAQAFASSIERCLRYPNPAWTASQTEEPAWPVMEDDAEDAMDTMSTQVVTFGRSPTGFPRVLEGTELTLLGNYIQRFSRSYPTCSDPDNPFLSVLLPLAMADSLVMDALLVLSSAQKTQTRDPLEEREVLRLRQRALVGVRTLLSENAAAPGSKASHSTGAITIHAIHHLAPRTVLTLLTTAVMFLLFDKISGETTWKPHIDFLGQLCEHFFHQFDPTAADGQAFQFLYYIFLYNDLVRATSLRTPTVSTIHDASPSAPLRRTSRFYFRNLIARISSGDLSVSETDIEAWDGNMHWLPSYSLTATTPADDIVEPTERASFTQLYKMAARIHLYERRSITLASQGAANAIEPNISVFPSNHSADPPNLAPLAAQAISLLHAIPAGSPFDNALLWPIGIAARHLDASQPLERGAVLHRLQDLERRFGMRHFLRVREVLAEEWFVRDAGVGVGRRVWRGMGMVLGRRMILLG